MRKQATHYGAPIVEDMVCELRREPDGSFFGRTGAAAFRTRNVILATGAVDIEPALANVASAVRRGLIRHCAICDGFEVIGQKIGVIGDGASALREALFLRTYTHDVTLLPLNGTIPFGAEDLAQAHSAAIKLAAAPVRGVSFDRSGACVDVGGNKLKFKALYSALGCDVRSELATGLGVRVHEGKWVVVDAHQESSMPGLYAAGDVVHSLNQIAVAMGHAAIAATAIHNRLPSVME
jgi:thioredoxin reductase (NADPH)